MVSQSSFAKAVALLSALMVLTNAHMIMKSPVPYGKSSLDNSPLIADGSNFPCKQRTGVYDLEGASNVMAIGDPQTLSFIGSAVHGGGSCQVSLTTDLQPSKSSKWTVIHSIEGGCPANVTGNLPDDPNGSSASTFQYTIPQGIAPGDYTIAWSWLNKIGNREYYMNCGPATITAAKKKRYAPAAPVSKRQTSFPDLFVANLAGVSNGCTTKEGLDILYPDPGQSVDKEAGGAFGPPDCTGSTAEVSSGASSASSPSATASYSSSPSMSSAPVPSVVPVATAAASASASASASEAPGVFATGASSAAPAAATSSAPAASSSAAPAPATGTTSAAAMSGACTAEGDWFCSADGSSFQRCASGVWSAAMPMSAGLKCTPGESSTLTETVGKIKRHTSATNKKFRRSAHKHW